MAISDWIVIAASFLVGLLLGIALGYLWGRASGATRGDLRVRSLTEQIDKTAGGMLQHTQAAGDQLAHLVGLIKHGDAAEPLKARPEAAYLAGIVQALFRLQEQLAALRSSSHRVEQACVVSAEDTSEPNSVAD
jgi:hypothetical protein